MAATWVWTILSFIGLCISLLAILPSRQEYMDSASELDTLKENSTGVRSIVLSLVKTARSLYVAHINLACLHLLFLTIGVASLLFPPANQEQSELRTLILIVLFIVAKIPSLTVTVSLFLATRALRKSRRELAHAADDGHAREGEE